MFYYKLIPLSFPDSTYYSLQTLTYWQKRNTSVEDKSVFEREKKVSSATIRIPYENTFFRHLSSYIPHNGLKIFSEGEFYFQNIYEKCKV